MLRASISITLCNVIVSDGGGQTHHTDRPSPELKHSAISEMFRSFFPSLVATSDSPSAEKDGAVTSSQEAASSKGDDAAGTENKAVANRIQKMDSIIR